MPTDCSADLFGFASVEGRRVEAAFDGGAISSNAGAVLLGATDRAIGLVERFAGCFVDSRKSEVIEHEVKTLVGQRVFGLALGYEDLNDHDWLRHDPVMAVLVGKLEARRRDCAPAAGKSTLNRLELSRPEPTRYQKISHVPAAIETLLVDIFLEAHATPPEEIVLDLDATDDPIHGEQEGRFFHGYYGNYCYLPLYVFCGKHLLASKLRRSNIDGAAGAIEEMERIIGQIRARWPEVRIVLRADSGFAREALMAWCEENRVDYLFGLAQNVRLNKSGLVTKPLDRRGTRRGGGGKRHNLPPRPALQGLHVDDARQLELPSAGRRQGRIHPGRGQSALRRDLVEPAAGRRAHPLRRPLLRPRRDGESHQGMPTRPLRRSHLDRHHARQLSGCSQPRLRLWFASMAYVLLEALRRLALKATKLANATCGTIRLKLLKIGALFRISVRRVKIAMASGNPNQRDWALAYAALGAAR